jgi:hypothetical protein
LEKGISSQNKTDNFVLGLLSGFWFLAAEACWVWCHACFEDFVACLNFSIEGLENVFLHFGRQQSKEKDFVGI